MQQALLYMAQVAIVQGLLLFLYWLLLRRDTFHTMKRFYLLGGICLSFMLPLIPFSFLHNAGARPMNENLISQYIPDLNFREKSWYESLNYWSYLGIIAAIGSCIFLIRICLQYRALKNIFASFISEYGEYRINIIEQPISPFSFGKTIYLNPSTHTDKELEEIIEHELVHIIQRHNIDIITSNINRSLLWWSPVSWLLNSVVRDNLEFISDRAIINKGFDATHYQYNLLRISQSAYQQSIAQHFNLSNLKKRIMMMNKQKTSSFHKMKWLLLIPALLFVLASFNFQQAPVNAKHKKSNQALKDLDTVPPVAPVPPSRGPLAPIAPVVPPTGKLTKPAPLAPIIAEPVEPAAIAETDVSPIAPVPAVAGAGNIPAIAPVIAPASPATPAVAPTGSIAKPPPPPPSPLDKPGRPLKMHYDRRRTPESVPTPAIESQIDSPHIEMSFQTSMEERIDSKTGQRRKTMVVQIAKRENNPLFIIDGKEAFGIEEEKFTMEQLLSVKVKEVKGLSATEKYGEKGKNGVLEIQSKKGEEIKVLPNVQMNEHWYDQYIAQPKKC